jgi:hypothetical protein
MAYSKAKLKSSGNRVNVYMLSLTVIGFKIYLFKINPLNEWEVHFSANNIQGMHLFF